MSTNSNWDRAALSVATTAYDLEQPLDGWIRAVTEAARPILDAGLGVLGTTFELVNGTLRRWGRIDVLVNNACAPFTDVQIPITALTMETWQEMVDTALTGAFLCIQHCVPPMRDQRWGRIVNVTTGWGLRGTPLLAHYCAAKAGLVGLTTSLAAELGAMGILVNAVAPGLVRTCSRGSQKVLGPASVSP